MTGDCVTFDGIKDILKPEIENKADAASQTPPPAPDPLSKMPEGEMVGKIFAGNYEILRTISDGSVSKTYLAMDRRACKPVAVKVMKIKPGPMPLDAVCPQHQMWMCLEHPYVSRLIDIRTDAQNIYIVREYLQGEDLETLIGQMGVVPVEKAVDWVVTLCDILSYLHSRSPACIARNLEPAHIIVHPDGEHLQLTEFGVVQPKEEPVRMHDPMLFGLGFEAPEQREDAQRADVRTDIYALGMILHYMVTGCSPVYAPYAPIRQYDPNLPQRLEDIIERCAEPDANKRFPTAEALKKALLQRSCSGILERKRLPAFMLLRNLITR